VKNYVFITYFLQVFCLSVLSVFSLAYGIKYYNIFLIATGVACFVASFMIFDEYTVLMEILEILNDVEKEIETNKLKEKGGELNDNSQA
jgi:hypothetical protein